MLGNIGVPELIIIFSIALMVFGPKKLPEVGRSIGKAIREFRRTSDEIKGKIEEEIQASEFKDLRKDIKDIQQDISGITDVKSHIFPEDEPPPAAKTETPPPEVKATDEKEAGKEIS